MKWLLKGEWALYGSSQPHLGYQNPLGDINFRCGRSALYMWFAGDGENHHSLGQHRTAPGALVPINFDVFAILKVHSSNCSMEEVLQP